MAYEVARKLRSAGADVARVVLLDSYVARDGQDHPPADEIAAITELATMNRLIYGVPADGGPQIEPDSPLPDQLEQLGRLLGASGALPVKQHIANLLRVYQANLEAIVDYQPFPSNLPVTLIKATGGFPQVMQPGREVHSYTDAPLHGWEYLDLPNLHVVAVPGDHFTVFAPPNLDQLAAALRDCLAAS